MAGFFLIGLFGLIALRLHCMHDLLQVKHFPWSPLKHQFWPKQMSKQERQEMISLDRLRLWLINSHFKHDSFRWLMSHKTLGTVGLTL